MKRENRSTAVAVIAAWAIPLGLGLAAGSEARHDGECKVGDGPYATIQSAVDDPACASIQVPKGTFYENVVVARDVTISGAGPRKTVVDGRRLDRVFYVRPASGPDGPVPSRVTLQGMAILGGLMPGSGPPITAAAWSWTVRPSP